MPHAAWKLKLPGIFDRIYYHFAKGEKEERERCGEINL
jgi:hypothetical protein